jgi:hypothetical protein
MRPGRRTDSAPSILMFQAECVCHAAVEADVRSRHLHRLVMEGHQLPCCEG